MASLYCLGCGHEFPAEGARRKPDRVGLFLFGGIGALLAATGAAALIAIVTSLLPGGPQQLWYGLLAILAGLGGIGIGRSLGKGLYSYCPACGKGMALPSESRSAKLDKRKRAG